MIDAFQSGFTLLLGLCIGATMGGVAFLKPQTLLILCLGFLAICLDTVTGVLFGQIRCLLTKGQINPLIGAAGISVYPMAAGIMLSILKDIYQMMNTTYFLSKY